MADAARAGSGDAVRAGSGDAARAGSGDAARAGSGDAAAPGWAGRLLTLDVGAPAHGGSCVARYEGRVVFVRHALPGERVRARVTEDRGGAFCLADAIDVEHASPNRVAPPCPHAGPGRCGGCDWQHADAAEQRRLKTLVVREQFARLAGLDLDRLPGDGSFGGVEELPGGLLGWRTRVLFARDRDGTLGLRRHHSHVIEPVRHCPLGRAGVGDAPADPPGLPADATGIELVSGTDPARPELALLAHRPGHAGAAGRAGHGRPRRGRRPPDRVELVAGPEPTHHRALGRDFAVRASGFWQVHPAAPETLAHAVLDAVAPHPGERVLELFAGAGLLTAALAVAVGPTGHVDGVEADAGAVADAAANLTDLAQAQVRRERIGPGWQPPTGPSPDLVVLDPPRAGVGAALMTALVDLRPRALCYVSCDPATLARDVAAAGERGWRLTALRAFDAFPMTHHVECVARLDPP